MNNLEHSKSDRIPLQAMTVNPAREKLEALIERGRSSAAAVVAEILNEQPVDYLVKASGATFACTDRNEPGLVLKTASGMPQTLPLHRNALGQVAQKLEIPWAYVDKLRSGPGYAKGLLLHNLNELATHDDARYLVRTAHGEVRGFLSDRYRRMDSRPILEAFIRAIQKSGAQAYCGVQNDTSFSLKAILPVVHEPVPGEALAFGMELQNSDFGTRALSVSLFVLRIRCANLAVMSEDLRKVHLGARLGDDAVYSQKTYRLDTKTICSAITDIVDKNLLPDRLETVTNLIQRAAEERISPHQLSVWMKRNLSKAEAEAVGNAFNSADIEMLPPGQSRWRFSNALSFVAGTLEDGERKLDFERFAGAVLQEVA